MIYGYDVNLPISNPIGRFLPLGKMKGKNSNKRVHFYVRSWVRYNLNFALCITHQFPNASLPKMSKKNLPNFEKLIKKLTWSQNAISLNFTISLLFRYFTELNNLESKIKFRFLGILGFHPGESVNSAIFIGRKYSLRLRDEVANIIHLLNHGVV